MTNKEALINWIKELEGNENEEIAIPYELYFDGNEEECCIITCNTERAGTAQELYVKLREMSSDEYINSVWVRFYDYEDALEDYETWVNSDTVWIITKHEKEKIFEMLKDFEPDEVWYEEEMKIKNINSVPEGYKIVSIWWD